MRGLDQRLKLLPVAAYATAIPYRPEPAGRAPQFFAFVRDDNGRPQILAFDDTPDGHEELLTIIRSEDLLGVVYGQRIAYDVDSTARLEVNGRDIRNTLSLNPER